MKIYITRHGETEWNKEGRMQGGKDSNLTDKGCHWWQKVFVAKKKLVKSMVPKKYKFEYV